ncbi:nicotinate-nucleotide--dimethylbenzimidazole phosphoribosyltransferase, partial [Thermodesulfobacteriota bacterium]
FKEKIKTLIIHKPDQMEKMEMWTSEVDLKKILENIVPLDRKWIEKAKDRTARLVMPARALGRLHEISERLCGIQKTLKPSIKQKAVLVMAGDHGVAAEGVSAYPQEVTGAMVRTFLAGGAGINAITRHVGADVWVVDTGIIPELHPDSMEGGDRLWIRKISKGTKNLAKGPAMSRQEAEDAILNGFNLATALFKKGVEILGTGDMGIGNTTPSAAIGAVITGKSVAEMVGRGTGIDDEGLKRKRDAIDSGIRINHPDPGDGLDVLSKLGGFEIGGITGCILAGAYHGRPVVIDGFISTAGAGLPLNLPEYLHDGDRTQLVPIISSGRAASILCQRWLSRFKYLPDAFVVEGPMAGGHLGFKTQQIDNPDFAIEKLVKDVIEAVEPFELKEKKTIPVIAAGGIFNGADILRFLQMGAAGVQMATRFVATHECDADIAFKEMYVGASAEDLTIIKSPVGLPGRVIRNQFVEQINNGQRRPVKCPYHCIKTCDPDNSPYCIALALECARRGKFKHGFAFAGQNAHRVKEIVSVKELMDALKSEYSTAAV